MPTTTTGCPVAHLWAGGGHHHHHQQQQELASKGGGGGGAQLPASGSSGSLASESECVELGSLLEPGGVAAPAAVAPAPAPAPGVHQAWRLTRPVLRHDPALTRRQLRALGRRWTLADVAKRRYCDQAWIAVGGQVFDITEHLATHPGWDSGCQVTTVLSILAHLGTDCTAEFAEIHRPYPEAWRQLRAFYIGDLEQGGEGGR